MNKKILALTIPNIVTNITVPLLGMVDLAIVGRVDGGVYLGAIAIGTTIFNMLYWGFGFLRMGTTGLAAQAYGGGKEGECGTVLVRSVSVGLVIGVMFLLLQIPLLVLAEQFMNISEAMLPEVKRYYYIRIWAAPAVMLLYAIKGWMLGMQDAKWPMAIALLINVVNIVGSALFAFYGDMGLGGVALGTVVAQYAGVAMGVVVIWRKYRKVIIEVVMKKVFVMKAMMEYFRINGVIFMRSLCLIAVFTFFTSASSSMGDDVLSANTLLLQLFTLFSYLMDGFAYAGESLTGRYFGAKDMKSLKTVIRLLMVWGVALSLLFTIVYALGLEAILYVFTSNEDVVAKAMEYRWWVVGVPICGFVTFLYDGIATGMLRVRAMRDTIFLATVMYFVLYYGLEGRIGNDALWIAFLLFLVMRGVGLWWIIRRDMGRMEFDDPV